MLKWMLYDKIGDEATMAQLGVYGACYKLSIIITLFIQAFRYAAEPFFFAHEKEKDSLQTYSKIMTYFVIVCASIFLGVLLYLDVVKYFIDREYWEGLKVVPILMAANIFLGMYYNQSIWYKLSGKTKWGAYLGVFGALITIGLNLLWIPVLGYVGSAWATLICYASMMLASYLLGQKYYPIPYNVKRILLYLLGALVVYLISIYLPYPNVWVMYAANSLLFLLFLTMVFLLERKDLRAVLKGA
jgi:O-antigen/teichoic acid export membrane protein